MNLTTNTITFLIDSELDLIRDWLCDSNNDYCVKLGFLLDNEQLYDLWCDFSIDTYCANCMDINAVDKNKFIFYVINKQ